MNQNPLLKGILLKYLMSIGHLPTTTATIKTTNSVINRTPTGISGFLSPKIISWLKIKHN